MEVENDAKCSKIRCPFTFLYKAIKLSQQVESLNLWVANNVRFSAPEFDLQTTLRKLRLDGAILSASIVSAISNLPNLEVLKLLDTSPVDETWDVEDNGFLNRRTRGTWRQVSSNHNRYFGLKNRPFIILLMKVNVISVLFFFFFFG